MIWKGLGVLGGTAALIVLGVVGLARLTVPDEPTFSEELEEASATGVEIEEFMPTAIGGELEVTGAAEGTINLERQVDGPTYGLGSSQSRVFFETDPLVISQMSHEGLAFFPEPDDCEFTEGQQNEDAWLIAVQVSCPELVDIRDQGAISIEGIVALPADLVIAQDLPERGGSVTVGDEEWELSPDSVLFIDPEHADSEGGPTFSVQSDDPSASLILVFTYDQGSGTAHLASVSYRGGHAEVEPGDCSTETEEVAMINPDVSFHEMSFSCESVQISSLGDVPIEGAVVYEQIRIGDDDH